MSRCCQNWRKGPSGWQVRRLGRPQSAGRSDCIEADCGNKPRIGSIIAWHWESWEGTWQGGWDDGPCHPDKTSSRALPVPTAAQCYNQHGYGESACCPRRSLSDPKRRRPQKRSGATGRNWRQVTDDLQKMCQLKTSSDRWTGLRGR